MTRGSERLEHLFSRQIDGEATLEEQQLLATLLAEDPQAQRLFDDYRRLDAAVGSALRDAVGAAERPRVLQAWWSKVGRSVLVAAAACIAMLIWLQTPATEHESGGAQPVQAASWFGPLPMADAVEEVPVAYERPALGVEGTQRDWILIPSSEPGEYMIIEVNRVQTQTVVVHQDF